MVTRFGLPDCLKFLLAQCRAVIKIFGLLHLIAEVPVEFTILELLDIHLADEVAEIVQALILLPLPHAEPGEINLSIEWPVQAFEFPAKERELPLRGNLLPALIHHAVFAIFIALLLQGLLHIAGNRVRPLPEAIDVAFVQLLVLGFFGERLPQDPPNQLSHALGAARVVERDQDVRERAVPALLQSRFSNDPVYGTALCQQVDSLDVILL